MPVECHGLDSCLAGSQLLHLSLVKAKDCPPACLPLSKSCKWQDPNSLASTLPVRFPASSLLLVPPFSHLRVTIVPIGLGCFEHQMN